LILIVMRIQMSWAQCFGSRFVGGRVRVDHAREHASNMAVATCPAAEPYVISGGGGRTDGVGYLNFDGPYPALEAQAVARLMELRDGDPAGQEYVRPLYKRLRKNACGELQPT
jgi:hypothetical protein